MRSLRARRAQVGHRVRAPTVGRLLNKHEYALHANAKKTEAGAQHPERDVQCRYRDSQKQVLMAGGKPNISVDTKNKAQRC